MKNIFKKLIIIIIVICIICVFVLWMYKNIFFPRKYKDIVNQAGDIYNVDPNLIFAVIKQESGFNMRAVSKSGAKGLMQIMDATAKDMANDIDIIDKDNYDIFDPYTNIFLGTKYISYLINHFEGNYYLAIAAYNAGLGKVEAWTNKAYNEYLNFYDVFSIIEYDETKDYLNNVITYYNYYVKLYN